MKEHRFIQRTGDLSLYLAHLLKTRLIASYRSLVVPLFLHSLLICKILASPFVKLFWIIVYPITVMALAGAFLGFVFGLVLATIAYSLGLIPAPKRNQSVAEVDLLSQTDGEPALKENQPTVPLLNSSNAQFEAAWTAPKRDNKSGVALHISTGHSHRSSGKRADQQRIDYFSPHPESNSPINEESMSSRDSSLPDIGPIRASEVGEDLGSDLAAISDSDDSILDDRFSSVPLEELTPPASASTVRRKQGVHFNIQHETLSTSLGASEDGDWRTTDTTESDTSADTHLTDNFRHSTPRTMSANDMHAVDAATPQISPSQIEFYSQFRPPQVKPDHFSTEDVSEDGYKTPPRHNRSNSSSSLTNTPSRSDTSSSISSALYVRTPQSYIIHRRSSSFDKAIIYPPSLAEE